MRAEQKARGEASRYDYHCRYLSAAERAEYERAGAPNVVRGGSHSGNVAAVTTTDAVIRAMGG